jgi:RNA polymerase sigma-70 factor (sigma-E family)
VRLSAEIAKREVSALGEMPDDGFSSYARESRPELRRQAFRICGDWHEADDLVQQTLIAVHSRWAGLDRRDRLAAYARVVMVRIFISDRRAHRWSREVLGERGPEPVPESGGEDRLGDRLSLFEALAQLGTRQRAAVVLRYWEDLSADDAARALSCSAATIRSQTSRALANLRTILRPDLSGS